MEQKSNEPKKRPAPSYQSRGMAIGIALGLIFGLMFDQMAVGLVLGIAVGTGIGRTLELQAQKKGNKGNRNHLAAYFGPFPYQFCWFYGSRQCWGDRPGGNTRDGICCCLHCSF